MSKESKIRDKINAIEALPYSEKLEAKHSELCDQLFALGKAKRRKAKKRLTNKADEQLAVDVDKAIKLLEKHFG